MTKEYHIEKDTCEIDAYLLGDSRGFNMLHIACEQGNAEIAEILLLFGERTETFYKGVNAQSLAWKGRHSKVLKILATVNLPYPPGIDISLLSNEFHEFYSKTDELHRAIALRDQTYVRRLLDSDENNMKYFYNLENESAAKVAIENKFFDIYEILIENDVYLAPEEITKGVFEDLDDDSKRVVRDLHTKHSKDHPDNHINILMVNSHSAHDGINVEENLKIVKKAYKTLNQIPICDESLRVVAASRTTEFYYDFNQKHVAAVDPTNQINSEGVYYPTGKIYIGAKMLTEEETFFEATGTMAHEIFHCAINLVYGNDARPYYANDHLAMRIFESINEKCREIKHKEEIIYPVYTEYPENMHHAELAVRPAHMSAHYHNKPEKLAEVKEDFSDLFGYIDDKVVQDMKKAIPEIRRREKLLLEAKDRKISTLKKSLYFLLALSIIGIGLTALISKKVLTDRKYTFDTLEPDEKEKVKNSDILYKNVKIKFKDLYADNSTAYYNLTSDDIAQMLHEKVIDISDHNHLKLDSLVRHSWPNMTKNLKEEFLNTEFKFQNTSLQYKTLYQSIPKAFDSLTNEQIKAVLSKQSLNVSSMIWNQIEFYIERKYSYTYGKYKREELFNNVTKATGGTNLGNGNILQYFGNKLLAENVIQNKSYVKFDLEYERYIIRVIKNITEVMALASKDRIFVLSSDAGAGKTVTFEQVALKLKNQHPEKWVSYIDLKDHVYSYNVSGTLDNLPKLLNNIMKLSSKNKFEMDVFWELYHSNNTILLWNGFDEISPTYTDFILNVLSEIHSTTGNMQFVCTRPLYAEHLEDKFGVNSFGLYPFTYEEQKLFLKLYFRNKNFDANLIDNLTQNVYAITENKKFNTPLMLKLMADVYQDGGIIDTEDLYHIYSTFVKKKVEIWQSKSETLKKLTNAIFSGEIVLDINKVYQKYGVFRELSDFQVRKLAIMKAEVPDELPFSEITRMGILYINNETDFEFAHKTFGEFFVAKYLIVNFYNHNSKKAAFDERILDLFYGIKRARQVYNFIVSYLETANDK